MRCECREIPLSKKKWKRWCLILSRMWQDWCYRGSFKTDSSWRGTMLRACWPPLWKMKELGGGLQEIWNAGQARQHTQISLLVLGMQWSEEKNTSKEMNMARNHSSHWLQDLFSWLMRPNAYQKHSAIGRFVPGALYVRLWCVLWIKVKVPQNYIFHAVSKIHPSLPN